MNIQGLNYKVYCNKGTKEIGGAGACYQDDLMIELGVNLALDAKISTLIHEVLEAINYHSELDLKHQQITILEMTLYQVLVANGVDLTPLMKDAEYRRFDEDEDDE